MYLPAIVFDDYLAAVSYLYFAPVSPSPLLLASSNITRLIDPGTLRDFLLRAFESPSKELPLRKSAWPSTSRSQQVSGFVASGTAPTGAVLDVVPCVRLSIDIVIYLVIFLLVCLPDCFFF